jgi:hypothetical protein
MSKEEVEEYVEGLLTSIRAQANMNLINTKSNFGELAEGVAACERQTDIVHNGMDLLIRESHRV